MPSRLTVNHSTVYRYRRPVSFNAHHLMFRPRDSHDMHVVETKLLIEPSATVRWIHDVFGNSIAIAEFSASSDRLCFISEFTVDHYGTEETMLSIEEHAMTIPFAYSDEELADLGRTVIRHYDDPDHVVDTWARGFLAAEGPTYTKDLLISMTSAIHGGFEYRSRENGLRTPVETLSRRSGTCRDFALLLMEAWRSLGLATRFVSGYLYDPSLDGAESGMVGSGATHAWVQVYVPGSGWVEFDPTNGLIGGSNLIRVAVARDPSQAVPIKGSYTGAAEDFIDMEVEVKVTANQPAFTQR